MNQAYINAYLNIMPTVYGIKLLPLSVGHALILDFISSPFFTGKQITKPDLITAIFFCSKTFDEGMFYLSNPKVMEASITEMGKPFYNKFIYEYEIEAFNKYYDYYLTFPRRWDDGVSKDAKVPWQLSIVWVLLDKFAEQEIMNMPLTKAMAFVACHSNYNGESNLAGVEQSELLDKWEQEEKEGKI